ncbi:hypothetical protein [Castellaniella sp.]|nr:hypothetical protein [Castellaniella sp.]
MIEEKGNHFRQRSLDATDVIHTAAFHRGGPPADINANQMEC